MTETVTCQARQEEQMDIIKRKSVFANKTSWSIEQKINK